MEYFYTVKFPFEKSKTEGSRKTMSNIGGKKTISTVGSVFLLINNSAGPGIALLPALYQQSGWAPTLFCTVLLAWLTYQIGIYFTEAIKSIPNNKTFDFRVEYIYLIKYYCQSTNYEDKVKNKNSNKINNTSTKYNYNNDDNSDNNDESNDDSENLNQTTNNNDESKTNNEATSIIGDIESRYYHNPIKDILDKQRKSKQLNPIYTSRKHVLSIMAQFAFYLFLLTLLISNIIQVFNINQV